MENPKFSILIPARNEERFIGACLDSIDRAARFANTKPEIIVVLNRCTDGTEQRIVNHALILREDSPNLARVRNFGAASARGDIIVTIDADSRMSENMLAEIEKALESGRFIGGGVKIIPERMSLGLLISGLILLFPFYIAGLSAGLFWCYRKDFLAIGGFDENRLSGEDLDFARRLKVYGRKRGKKFGNIRRAHITTSVRKFDKYGDWLVLKLLFTDPIGFISAFRGKNADFAKRFWYGNLEDYKCKTEDKE